MLPRLRLVFAAPNRQKRGVEPAEYDLMDAAEQDMWWYRALHAHAIASLQPERIGAGGLLDAGCGTGGFLVRLRAARPDLEATGLEYFAPAAARARAKADVPVVIGSVNSMPFAAGRFGAVVSLDVLCHAAVEPRQALAEMAHVLAPGGILLLNLPAFDWLRSAHDRRVRNIRRFTAAGVQRLLAAAGFTAIRTRYWNALLLPAMAVQRKLRARAPDHGSDVAPFPPWLDRSLHAVTVLERRLMRLGLPFPAGGSILATATRA